MATHGQITDAQLDDWFSYHAPSGDQPDRYEAIRAAGQGLAAEIVKSCPPGPDTTAALRKVREAVMTANASIACNGGILGGGA